MSTPTLSADLGPAATQHPFATPPGDLFPSLTTTVPREFVHRAAVAEVMLTGWHGTGDEARFRVTAQWPRGHSFFSPVSDHHDPLIAAETIRQAGSLLAHAVFGVPFGRHFLMWELAFDTEPGELRVGGAPAALDIDVTCTDVQKRGDDLTGMRYETVVRRDGRTAVTGAASFTCITPAVYRRLRKGRHDPAGIRPLPLTAPVPPQSVGRLSPTDVVLSPGGAPHRWRLRVDTGHPVLFDHPVDHVPGMLLMEAARQASAAVLGRPGFRPVGVRTEFDRYAELDQPCVIAARRLPRGVAGEERVEVTGEQDGVPVFRSTVLARPGRR